MCPLHHSNLVRLYGGVWNEGADKLCIVLELCANGSLDGFLRLRTATSWNQLGYGLALGASKGMRAALGMDDLDQTTSDHSF